MQTVHSKLAVFTGKGANMAKELKDCFSKHSAILMPFMETCSEALSSCYPDLYNGENDVAMDGKKFDLLGALESDTLNAQLDNPAVSGSLSTISQLANFFVHMKMTGRGYEHDETFVATAGDEDGLISAVAIAASASEQEFGFNVGKAVKAAFYAGKAEPGTIAEEWNNKGIKFSRPRIPVIAGSAEDLTDLRESDNVTGDMASYLSSKHSKGSPDWEKMNKMAEGTGAVTFGSSKPLKEELASAIVRAGGKQCEDWQLESSGAGGASWESVDILPAQSQALIDELKACPEIVNLEHRNFLQTYPTPGDLLRALEKGEAANQVPRESWKWSEVNWIMSYFLVVNHFMAAYGLYLIWNHPLRNTFLFQSLLVLYPITGCLGITGGAHRLWSHRSYKAHFPARLVMMIANSIANQGSIYHWSRDHRVHHAKSDTEADPHDITRGFFYSHMGWLMLKKRQAVKEAGKKIDCSDLLEDPLVWIQDKCDPWWNVVFCFALPALYTWYMYDEALLGLLVFGSLRWLVTLHATWTVNSVAHTFGPRPYCPNMYPTESWFTTLVAVGEGYHNWHHTYPYDYSASELGWLNTWNPTTLWIDFLCLIGQAYGCKRAIHRKEKMA